MTLRRFAIALFPDTPHMRSPPKPMNAVPPSGQTTQRAFDTMAVAVVAVLTVVAALTFKDYGLGWDDYTQAEYGGLLLRGYNTGFTDQRAFHFVNLYAYGGGFDMLAAYASKFLPFDLWETRRLCGALVGIVGIIAVWRVARRIGGPLAGLLAVVLIATTPLYYGHMFINPKDGPFAVTMTIALLGTVRLFQEYPRPSAMTIAIAGIGFGLAIGTRILGGFSVVYGLVALAFVVAAEWHANGWGNTRRRLGAFLIGLVPVIVVAYCVMALVWPWAAVDPTNPVKALLYFSEFFEAPWRELFAGQLIMVPEMPRHYVPQLMLLKLPEILLLLGLAGVATACVVIVNGKERATLRAKMLVLVLSATVPVLVTVITRPAMYNGIRHFVFVVPALAVLGGWAGALLLQWLKEKQKAIFAAAAIAVAVAVSLPVADMVRLHPYQYISFNHAAGGITANDPLYMLDYWGLAFKQAAKRLNVWIAEHGLTPPGGHQWKIAVCGPQRPAQVELGPHYDISWNPAGAQFVMSLGEYYCANLDAPVLVEVKREGVVFARVYDIREKNFTSILISGK